jgi:hypothetical protein
VGGGRGVIGHGGLAGNGVGRRCTELEAQLEWRRLGRHGAKLDGERLEETDLPDAGARQGRQISSSSRAGKADGQDDSHPGVLLCLVDVDKRAAQLQAGREGRQVVAFCIGETRRDKVGVDVELTEVMKVGACASRPCCVSTDA